MMKISMSNSRKRGDRPRRILRCLLVATAFLPFLAAGRSSAAPLAVNVTSGNLYEIDLSTGEYWLAAEFDHPVRCGPLTGADDTFFCTAHGAIVGEGTWVRRLERSSASVVWEVSFPELPSPDAIAYSDSRLYVVARTSLPRRFFLLTLDPATGEEMARIELPELGLQRPYALAARGRDLWLLRGVAGVGTRLHRIDPLTGTMLESVEVPGISVVDDAEFGPDGRLWFSLWLPGPVNASWCTHYWMVPFLGAPAEPQFDHCWHAGDPPVPNLAHFTLASAEAAAVEIPTLGAVSVGVFAVLLSLTGVFVLRARGACFRLSRDP